LHYYKFNIPDWTLHTAHLSPEEEGIYLRLVNFYYDTEEPIPAETQSVIRRLRLGNHSDTVGEILEEFFYLDGDWKHKRCDEEVEIYHSKVNTNRLNGSKGGRPKGAKPKITQSVNSGNPNITLTKNHKPITKRGGNSRFIPPTAQEVQEYLNTKGITEFDGQRFCDHYEAVGWMRGKNKIKNWKACVATWNKNQPTSEQSTRIYGI